MFCAELFCKEQKWYKGFVRACDCPKKCTKTGCDRTFLKKNRGGSTAPAVAGVVVQLLL